MGKQLLTRTAIENMHQKILESLETIGIRFENDEALEIFKKRGAKVEGNIVYLSEKLVTEALSLLPAYEYPPVTERKVTGQLFYGVPILLDDDTQQYRPVTVADAVKMYKLGETSDLYEGASIAIVDPYDNDADDKYVGQMAMLLKYSDKYITNGLRATALNSKNGDVYRSAYNAVKLIKDFYGVSNDENVMCQIICPKSPLTYDEECIFNIKAVVEQGQSIMLSPCSLTNLTGPSTILGINVHDMALSLAGIAYIQFMRPGTPVSLATCSAPIDLRAVQPSYGTAEAVFISIIYYELSKFYKIKCDICALLSDSAKIDYQSGVESLLTTLLPFSLADINIAYCYPGLMSAFYCGSFIKAIYDEEIMRYMNRIFKGVKQELDPELMDSMKMAMEKNTFLYGRTSKAYRDDHYLTQIFSKHGVSQDAKPELTDIKIKAQNEIKKRLEMYQLPERTSAQQKLLQKYLPTQCKY